MSQRTDGLLAILSKPLVYRTYHSLIGSPNEWDEFVRIAELSAGDRVLDLGCGPGTLADHVADVSYLGYDLSEPYVKTAQAKWGARGEVRCADVTTLQAAEIGRFDRVLAHGLLHHIDDSQARRVGALAAKVLEPAGRFVTVDGCYVEGQSRGAKFMLDNDRGQSIRSEEGYRELLTPYFGKVEIQLRDDLLRIPYTLAIAVCEDPI